MEILYLLLNEQNEIIPLKFNNESFPKIKCGKNYELLSFEVKKLFENSLDGILIVQILLIQLHAINMLCTAKLVN